MTVSIQGHRVLTKLGTVSVVKWSEVAETFVMIGLVRATTVNMCCKRVEDGLGMCCFCI